jgi:hypothetical protein
MSKCHNFNKAGLAITRRTVLVAMLIGIFSAGAGGAWATNWVEALKTGSNGESHAQSAPSAPTGVTAACSSSTAMTVTVSWAAVAKATSYTVYDTTTSSTGTYASVASGVTTVPYTTGSLAADNYWFKVGQQ